LDCLVNNLNKEKSVLLIIVTLFNFLNTRNFLGKRNFNRPLVLEHEDDKKQFINSSRNYLQSLKAKDHQPITTSERKTEFNGLIIYLKSMGNLFDDVIKSR